MNAEQPSTQRPKSTPLQNRWAESKDVCVEARAPGRERGTKDRHARRTLVRRALIVADVWALGFTFAIVHMILGTSAKQGFTSGQELILFVL